MKLGARVLKTGVAVSLALYISAFLNLSPPIIAAVASIFALQPTIYRSWRHILEQVQTNTLGAILAWIGVQFFQNNPLAVGIVCIIVIIICLRLKMEDSIGLTLVTVTAIMNAPAHYSFALTRFVLIMTGIGAAFIVNALFLPPKPEEKYIETVRHVFGQLSVLLRTSISNDMKENVYQGEKQALGSAVKTLGDRYTLFEEEHKKLKRRKHSDIRLMVVYKQMLAAAERGWDILETVEEHYFQARRTAELNEFFDNHVEHLIHYHEHVLMKFDNKLKPDTYDNTRIEEDNDQFMRDYMDLYGISKEGKLRLSIVAAVIYDYGHQIARLDKLVEQWHKHSDERTEATQ